MELLPAPQQQMEAIMDVLRTTYSLYGFTPLDTPAIEAADVVLMDDDPLQIAKAIKISRKCIRIVYENRSTASPRATPISRSAST